MTRHTGVSVFGALTVLLGAVALGGGGISQQAAGSAGDMPSALSAHLDRLAQAIPGNGGESNRGPGGADEAYLEALAYPATDIPLAQLTTAHSAASTAKGRSPIHGSKGWVSIGSALRESMISQSLSTVGRTRAQAVCPAFSSDRCALG